MTGEDGRSGKAVAASRRHRERRLRYVLRFGALGYLTMLLLVPVGLVFFRTFQHGLRPAWAAVTNPQALHALWLTLIIAAIAVPLNTAFGVVLGIALVRHRFPGRGLLNAIVDLPLALSPVVVGLALYLLYGTGGWLAGLSEHGIKILFSLPGMTLATIFVSLPFVVREVVPVLREIGTDQEQAAETLGAAPFTTFRRITLPAIRWAVSYGVVLTTARAIGEFGAVSIVSGRIEGKTETLPLYVQSQFDSSLGINPIGAFAASVVLALIALMTVLAMRLFRTNAASFAMPLGGRGGFAGAAVSNRLAGRIRSESDVNDSEEEV